MLSDKTLQCLIRAGWTPERRVDNSEWVTKLDHIGITLSPAAHEFMSCYAGLDIRVPYDIDGKYWEDKIQIALLDPTFEPRASYTKDTKELTGLSLFMIEDRDRSYGLLYMSPDGCLFEDTEDFLTRYSNPSDNAIDVLLSNYIPIEDFDEASKKWIPCA